LARADLSQHSTRSLKREALKEAEQHEQTGFAKLFSGLAGSNWLSGIV
jgi:hypothetical protein